ncbi:sugar ABC transporter permease [Streptococcus suis]|uniref:Multiple sugar transport system permease protein n=1 Tax=Streptococcus parasuis TaxID=1501662 RepID=A0ABV2EPN6_9STRE|nr:sugar ABC transporter permease [Streptococcus parasuis]MDG4514428.1 sugar ABC transporter permease [Streptococcus suis]NQM29444.1 sugar ABC transporter permease [Streptococcus suis]NQN91624.1 sugar ABC transporter permease [Streptococcus suis]NQP59296.1 sugar ABC transporter permease [Streptococcus suis]BCP60216.1 sugar ABC transporter permease protein [Streptococcus parasuis]
MLKMKMSQAAEKRLLIFTFTIIPVLLLLTFSYYPLVKMFQYSLTNWNGYSPNPDFVGLDNYKTILTKPTYFTVFKTSLYYFIATFFQLGIALLFATILSFKVKFANFWKGILFFPYLLNGVAIGFIFLYFYKGGGTLDTVLEMLGLGDQIQLWLGNREINNISLAFTSVWRYTGFNFLVFLGAIQSINPEIYEAAEIDGANRWDQFIYIIFPSIRNIIFLNIILGVSGSLSVFDIPYIMTGGSNGTTTFVIQTIDTAFKYNKVGLASAMAIILLVIVVVVTLVQRYATQERK